ncbi:hypothetical protein [Enterococcus thailandicus]|uniref:Uncharacterized protein n=1 Tax=Enterococcus thailandicus TaxID=417368 RepID=A0A510WCA0_ENTTH|nr:hypothetical protein ETH01_10730 [Enterococcus thailandicus]
MSISQTICDFATLSISSGGFMEMDRIYLQNRLLSLIGEEALQRFRLAPVASWKWIEFIFKIDY